MGCCGHCGDPGPVRLVPDGLGGTFPLCLGCADFRERFGRCPPKDDPIRESHAPGGWVSNREQRE